MELRHLRVFAAAGELLSFAQAAERLGIAQPAVSQQVKAFGDRVGFPAVPPHPPWGEIDRRRVGHAARGTGDAGPGQPGDAHRPQRQAGGAGASTSELVIAVSIEHPLANHDCVPLSVMAGHSLILMSDPDGYGLGHQTLEMFRLANLQPQIGFRLENIMGIIGLIAANSGFAIIPRVLAETVGSVASIRIEGPPIVSAITIVCRKINPALHVQRFIKAAVGMA